MHGRVVNTNKCPALSGVPKNLSTQSMVDLLALVDNLNVCPCHPDDRIVHFAQEQKGRIGSATLDESASVTLNGEEFSATVRCVDCELLTHGTKCACIHYCPTLRATLHRHLKHSQQMQKSPSHSHINNRFMNTP